MNNFDGITGLSSDLYQALQAVRPDGRLPREAHDILVKAFTAKSLDSGHKHSFAPAEYLGNFEVLPVNVKEAIVRALMRHDKWSMAGPE